MTAQKFPAETIGEIKRQGRAITGGTMPTKEQWLAQAFVRFFYAAMNGNDPDAGANLGAVLFECRGCDEELMAEAVSALVSADELPEVLEIVRMMVEGDHLKKSLFRRPNQSQD
jgi:hypothetical protein